MPEGKLYLVGTPIGNLGDLSPRAVRTLERVDFIAAEDTRVTLKLLTHFGVKKPLLSYNEHNRAECGPRILNRLLAGESCALVTDAGMPAISDPGADLVCLCAGAGVETVIVPGPCAAVSALALSALPTQRFCFEGFLSTANKSRMEHLESLRTERRTMIFYEAPHKLQRTLDDFLKYFGDRPLSLCRELTKVHEEVIEKVIDFAATVGLESRELEFSPIKGPEGNIEYLLHLLKRPDAASVEPFAGNVQEIVAQAHGTLDK